MSRPELSRLLLELAARARDGDLPAPLELVGRELAHAPADAAFGRL
jgi:hypothetical protein